MKKGLSPVIASVLMILLVISISVMIFGWARGFLDKQNEGLEQSIENLCESANFETKIIKTVGDYSILEIVNKGNINIHSLEIKKFIGGNSETNNIEINLDSGGASTESIYMKMENGVSPETIVIYPILTSINTKKTITCLKNEKTIFP